TTYFYWPQSSENAWTVMVIELCLFIGRSTLACMDCLALRNTPIREAAAHLASASVWEKAGMPKFSVTLEFKNAASRRIIIVNIFFVDGNRPVLHVIDEVMSFNATL